MLDAVVTDRRIKTHVKVAVLDEICVNGESVCGCCNTGPALVDFQAFDLVEEKLELVCQASKPTAQVEKSPAL